MERSEYQEFMDCYNLFETITRAAISAVVICEWLQKHDPGTMATERDTQEMAQEVERRLAFEKSGIYANALASWVESRYEQSDTDDEEAADDGGFSVTHFDNST